MNQILIILLALILSSCNQPIEEGWQLVYRNDKNGNSVSGDKMTLKKAIESGCEIRVAWSVMLKNNNEIKHLTEAFFLSIHHDEVFAQVEAIMRQIPDADRAVIDLDTLDNKKWYSIVGTTGEMRSVFSGIQRNRIRRIESSWYINKADCPVD